MKKLQSRASEFSLAHVLLPTVAGLAGALYSRYLRHHPWAAALMIGLAVATLAYGGIKSRQRLQWIYRVARSPWRRE